MYKINFNEPSHVHFIGIGGISMSGLAEILLTKGFRVSGSDACENKLTAHLAEKGVRIHIGQRAENLSEMPDFVVYTAAVKQENPEFAHASMLGLPLLTRAELLGQIMDVYKISAGISGTHGKTSTTSMLAEILLDAEADPTISVGGIQRRIGGNIYIGSSPIFITEACEYTNSFLSLHPTIGVILNIFADHMDFFKDLDDIRHSFRLYAENIQKGGSLIIHADIQDLEGFTKGLECKIITFGLTEGCTWRADKIAFDSFACGSFDLIQNSIFVDRIHLKVTGEHNILNALAAIAAASEMGMPMDKIISGISAFSGTDRRFQLKGNVNGVTVIDDYAHHPDEIRATLTAAKNYPHRKIWCIFQPHTFSRTKAFLKDFAAALSLADEVVLAEIYPARETDTLGISTADLQKELHNIGKNSYYFPSFAEIQDFLSTNCMNGDLLITMGAGNIVDIADALVSQ